MNKHNVIIEATFANKAAYLAHAPTSVRYHYEYNGKPLSLKDLRKIRRITEYYLKHDLHPIFITENGIVNDTEPVIAEGLVKLNNWTNDKAALPRYAMKDTHGKRFNTPICNRLDILK